LIRKTTKRHIAASALVENVFAPKLNSKNNEKTRYRPKNDTHSNRKSMRQFKRTISWSPEPHLFIHCEASKTLQFFSS